MNSINIANNCRPKFKKQTIYWIEDVNGAYLGKNGIFQYKADGPGQAPLKMDFSSNAYTAKSLPEVKRRLITCPRMSGSCSAHMMIAIEPKNRHKTRKSRYGYRPPFAYDSTLATRRGLEVNINSADFTDETGAFNLRKYHHSQRMLRQENK